MTKTFLLVSICIVVQLWNECGNGVMALHAEWHIHQEPVPPLSRISPRRSGHAAAIYQNLPYVFGGYAEEEEDNSSGYRRYALNDLWRYRPNNDGTCCGWEPVVVQGDIPGPRLVTAMASLSLSNHDDDKTMTEYLYILGGWDPQIPGTGGIILDDVYRFHHHGKSNEWEKLDVTLPDGPASRHVAVSIPIPKNDNNNNGKQQHSRILLHNHRCQDFVWLFDGTSFQKQVTTGPCPSPRGLHAASAYGTNLFLYGGAAQDQTMSNECFLLDTHTWEWKTLRPGPSPRASPAMARYQQYILVFGGAEMTTSGGLNPKADLWAFNMETMEWIRLLEDGPPPRNAATLSEIDPQRGTFVLTGGWAPFQQTWDDCYILTVSE